MIGWYIAILLYLLGAYVAVTDAQELIKNGAKTGKHQNTAYVVLTVFWPIIAFLVMAEEAYKSMKEE